MISIVSNGYYGMPRGQIHINLLLEHPIMSSEAIEIKMAAVSAKRSILFGGLRAGLFNTQFTTDGGSERCSLNNFALYVINM